MASYLTRRYNRSFEQLRTAVWRAFQHAYPGAYFHEPQPGVFLMHFGMHWPFTSYGETLEVRLVSPGVVTVDSRYKVPTQLFELGDNVANVEQLARSLEDCCRALPASCPACSVPVNEGAGGFCGRCGYQLHNAAAQPPVPQRAGHVRALGCLLPLLLVLLLLGIVAGIPFMLDNLS